MGRKDDDIQITMTPEVQQRLLQAMEEKGITMYQLAKDINCAFSTITNYCSGKISKPNPGKIDAICKALSISKHWLATGENNVSDVETPGEAKDSTMEWFKQSVEKILIKIDADDHQYHNLHTDFNYVRKELSDIQISLKKLTDLQADLLKTLKKAIEDK